MLTFILHCTNFVLTQTATIIQVLQLSAQTLFTWHFRKICSSLPMILLIVKFYSNAMTTNLQKFVTSCLLLCSLTTAMSFVVSAVLMWTSPESKVLAPDILGHQLVGSYFFMQATSWYSLSTHESNLVTSTMVFPGNYSFSLLDCRLT